MIFGLYVPIISAVKSVITFDFAYLPILIVFALGILTGAASVVRIIKWALDKHRPIMIFFDYRYDDWFFLCNYHGTDDIRNTKKIH